MSMQDNQDDAIIPVRTQCDRCQHRSRINPYRCAAFPSGIPLIIYTGQYDHTMEFDFEGVSDNGITFTPVE